MTVRDSQRSAFYAAQDLVQAMFDRADATSTRQVELHGSTITLPIERRFASVDSVQTYCNRLLALNWIQATYAPEAVRVRARAGSGAAHYESGGVIAVPTVGATWALRELVVLHELAHHLVRGSAEAAHGRTFRETYLNLVTEIVGPEAALVLLVALHDNGIR